MQVLIAQHTRSTSLLVSQVLHKALRVRSLFKPHGMASLGLWHPIKTSSKGPASLVTRQTSARIEQPHWVVACRHPTTSLKTFRGSIRRQIVPITMCKPNLLEDWNNLAVLGVKAPIRWITTRSDGRHDLTRAVLIMVRNLVWRVLDSGLMARINTIKTSFKRSAWPKLRFNNNLAKDSSLGQANRARKSINQLVGMHSKLTHRPLAASYTKLVSSQVVLPRCKGMLVNLRTFSVSGTIVTKDTSIIPVMPRLIQCEPTHRTRRTDSMLRNKDSLRHSTNRLRYETGKHRDSDWTDQKFRAIPKRGFLLLTEDSLVWA